jgi:predicted AlkP superfamily phosphohydrolase/phosphomutase
VVALVSDHGARALAGSFCLNEWLAQEGYLALRTPAAGAPVAFDPALVDWESTRAFADGGYCGRVYLHGARRDVRGALAGAAARALRDELRAKLEALRAPDGSPLGNAVHLPEEVYARVNGVAPDLLVYAGDLDWRCAASVGHGRAFIPGNDTGPDRANHDWDGVFALRDPERAGAGRTRGATLLDVAPTLLGRLGLSAPGWMRGGRLP